MKRILLILGIGIFLSSCEKKNLPEVGSTSAEKMANEWWVELSEGPAVYTDHFKMATYNTAANDNTIFIDDLDGLGQFGYSFKIKAQADYNAMTFTAAKSANEYDPTLPITITNGKILPNAGHSRSGVLTDSIRFDVQFEGDPSTYTIAGTARTRLAEDDY